MRRTLAAAAGPLRTALASGAGERRVEPSHRRNPDGVPSRTAAAPFAGFDRRLARRSADEFDTALRGLGQQSDGSTRRAASCAGRRDGSTWCQRYSDGWMDPLFLSWQQPDNWWPVGRVSRDGADFVFSYTEGASSAAAAGFRPLSGFPEFDQVYRSSTLFPILRNRLPPRSRPDYGDFVDWLDLPRDEQDPLVLLARSGGQRETDRFEVFSAPDPQSDGNHRATFFLQGLRYGSREAKDEVARLEAGDELALEAEPGNPGNALAIRILARASGVHIGFVPRYLCTDLHALIASPAVRVRVRRLNSVPAPVQFRVLCDLDARWPPGFAPLAGPEFRAIAALPPAVTG